MGPYCEVTDTAHHEHLHKRIQELEAALERRKDMYSSVLEEQYYKRIQELEAALREIADKPRYGCCSPLYPDTPPCAHNIARQALKEGE